MLSFKAGEYECWQGFRLHLESDINLSLGTNYYLHGANGSGKSTFIKKLLLPSLQSSRNQVFSLYIQQHFHLQAYLIKAEAALLYPEHRPHSMADCLDYLLCGLSKALEICSRPVVIVADETPKLELLLQYLNKLPQPSCLIYSMHGDHKQPAALQSIHFEPLSPYESKVTCIPISE